MSRELQPRRQWLDEISPTQYKFPVPAVIRRQVLEHSRDRVDYYGRAFSSLGLEGGETILNVGSGDGRDEVRLATEFGHHGQIIGLDVPSSDGTFEDRFYLSEILLSDAGKENVTFVPGNAMALPFPDNYFDVVMWIQSGYHFPDIIRALKESRRVLRDKGKFLNLTNARNNKRRQHSMIREIKADLGVREHRPFSSGFNFEQSLQIIPYFFNPIEDHPIEQDTEYEIFEDTLPELVYSVDSYRASMTEEVYKKWIPVRKKVMAARVEPEIDQTGSWLDTLHRGGGLYENSHRLRTVNNYLGQLAINRYRLG